MALVLDNLSYALISTIIFAAFTIVLRLQWFKKFFQAKNVTKNFKARFSASC